ncbi:MAG: hypothetical protein AB7T63_01975 [Planctomycetota bacterium]
MRIVRTRHGARVEQGGLVLSEVRRDPGPTHSLFDVLAAAISTQVPGHRVAVLGFAMGGIVAPLRALGFGHPIEAVDLDVSLVPPFRELSEPWCGDVRVERGEAGAWLRKRKRPFDLILEDLSAQVDGEVTKPPVSLGSLPMAIRARLKPGGVAVTNVLPVPGRPLGDVLATLAAPYARAVVLHLERWENKVLLCGDAVPAARDVGRALRSALAAIGSCEADQLAVRTLAR